MIEIIHIILIAIAINGATAALSGFTCQGGSYISALGVCPDSGSQALSSGGNVTILVKYATNLPNRDASGPAAGVSDPYVKFTVGSVSAQTKDIRNNLNPVWNEYVSLGFLGSATEFTVEVWDRDSGLEFADDILARTTMRVPFCSTFRATTRHVDCGSPFGCASDDSLWQMPERQVCNESGTVNFGNQLCSSSSSVCLYLEVLIVPYTMRVRWSVYC
jgi:hypothetical protein